MKMLGGGAKTAVPKEQRVCQRVHVKCAKRDPRSITGSQLLNVQRSVSKAGQVPRQSEPRMERIEGYKCTRWAQVPAQSPGNCVCRGTECGEARGYIEGSRLVQTGARGREEVRYTWVRLPRWPSCLARGGHMLRKGAGGAGGRAASRLHTGWLRVPERLWQGAGSRREAREREQAAGPPAGMGCVRGLGTHVLPTTAACAACQARLLDTPFPPFSSHLPPFSIVLQLRIHRRYQDPSKCGPWKGGGGGLTPLGRPGEKLPDLLHWSLG